MRFTKFFSFSRKANSETLRERQASSDNVDECVSISSEPPVPIPESELDLFISNDEKPQKRRVSFNDEVAERVFFSFAPTMLLHVQTPEDFKMSLKVCTDRWTLVASHRRLAMPIGETSFSWVVSDELAKVEAIFLDLQRTQ
ncbi:hypothetical protein D9758_004884 [Tetrapyrgos nigripes]|uniref:Uncharacterized protein n=1 Tax=Tetrapyrgos nigripes TaxID=182062 RepID=A0A8H5LJ08_9AGAR|nr:hypothetical protein D9758_004884 [Tetrapyrgos nigripes]